MTEKEKTAANRVLFALYGEEPAQEQDDAAAAEGLQDLHCHQPVDEYAGRCIVVEGPGQVQELINNMRIDMDPQWMIIVRLPDSRHAITNIRLETCKYPAEHPERESAGVERYRATPAETGCERKTARL